jgi:hypothetical protein
VGERVHGPPSRHLSPSLSCARHHSPVVVRRGAVRLRSITHTHTHAHTHTHTHTHTERETDRQTHRHTHKHTHTHTHTHTHAHTHTHTHTHTFTPTQGIESLVPPDMTRSDEQAVITAVLERRRHEFVAESEARAAVVESAYMERSVVLEDLAATRAFHTPVSAPPTDAALSAASVDDLLVGLFKRRSAFASEITARSSIVCNHLFLMRAHSLARAHAPCRCADDNDDHAEAATG